MRNFIIGLITASLVMIGWERLIRVIEKEMMEDEKPKTD